MRRGLYAFNAIIWLLFDQIDQFLITLESMRWRLFNMATIGRPKGSGNKPLKRLLAERLAEKYPSYDPVLELVEATIKIKAIAESTGDIADYKSLVDSLEKTSRFIQPQLKSVEVQTDNALTISVQRKRYDGSQSNDTDNADS